MLCCQGNFSVTIFGSIRAEICWKSHSTCQHSWAGTQVGWLMLHCSLAFSLGRAPGGCQGSRPSQSSHQMPSKVSWYISKAENILGDLNRQWLEHALCSYNEFIIQGPEVTKIIDWLITHSWRVIMLQSLCGTIHKALELRSNKEGECIQGNCRVKVWECR